MGMSYKTCLDDEDADVCTEDKDKAAVAVLREHKANEPLILPFA